ncbi:MAG TPA: hypothetical protein VH253_10420 [Phycisphaerae bacterium]|nr:hypothetical protein [Phycisphaerae bacterium]
MDGRHYRESLRRLRLFAQEAPLTPATVSKIVQPFIDHWKPVPVPNLKYARAPMQPFLSPAALDDLAARIRAIGMNLHKSGLKGIHYHNAFQKQLAALAEVFDARGWNESPALFDDPDLPLPTPNQPAAQLAGRVDVVWSVPDRTPVLIMEIDSTVKARSFQKLKEAAAPHKLWIYFGRDIWAFRMFLAANDPDHLITPILIPHTFVPSFDDVV